MKREAFIECGNEKLYFLFSVIEFDDMPMLFVLENDRRDLYLGLCADSRGFFRWTLAKTTIETIEELIDKKMTINDAIGKDNGNVKLVEFRKDKGFSYELGNVATISPYDLTKPGLFARYIEEDVDEQVEAYKQRCQLEVEQYRTEADIQMSEKDVVSASQSIHCVMDAEKMERPISQILDLYVKTDGTEKYFSDECVDIIEAGRKDITDARPVWWDKPAETTAVKDKGNITALAA